MANNVRITYHGMEGVGRNLTEAKKDAGRKIAAVLEGSYEPQIIGHRGYAYLIYREPSGWHCRLIADPDRGPLEGIVYGTHCQSKLEALEQARMNMAQLAFPYTDDLQPPKFLTLEQQKEFRLWAEFQLRYRAAREHGLNDHDAHSYAGRNPARPELWKDEPCPATP